MNYAFTLSKTDPDALLDFSRIKLDTLYETKLVEEDGVTAYYHPDIIAPVKTIYSYFDPIKKIIVLKIWPTGEPIDWNGNEKFNDVIISADKIKPLDINNMAENVCNGKGYSFEGFDDWKNLLYNHRAPGSGLGDLSVPLTQQDLLLKLFKILLIGLTTLFCPWILNLQLLNSFLIILMSVLQVQME
ncbi:MAG: hypothetical protein HRO68_04375 [Nitrosopumilus sp.]|nr:hypothetical protein [Nitrosopumilus sp.]